MRFFDAVAGGAPLVDLASRAVSALEGAATALTKIAHNAELVGTAMHAASRQAADVCQACDTCGRLRCTLHGPDGSPQAWTGHPEVAAHIAVGCRVTVPGGDSTITTAWCDTHNVSIRLTT